MAAPDTLPDRIELRELLLRRWSQADAAILFAAICDRSNRPSAAVAARLGYRLDRIEDGNRNTRGRSGRQLIWTMTCDAYPGSAAENRLRESG